MEKNQINPVEENGIKFSDGMILIERNDGGYICINPEILPRGIPSKRFHCFYVSKEHGSSIFYVRLGENMRSWVGEWQPPFVNQALIEDIGKKIERRDA